MIGRKLSHICNELYLGRLSTYSPTRSHRSWTSYTSFHDFKPVGAKNAARSSPHLSLNRLDHRILLEANAFHFRQTLHEPIQLQMLIYQTNLIDNQLAKITNTGRKFGNKNKAKGRICGSRRLNWPTNSTSAIRNREC